MSSRARISYPVEKSGRPQLALNWIDRLVCGAQSWRAARRNKRRSEHGVTLTPVREAGIRALEPDDLPLVVLSHNGRRFWPSFLAHYRKLGVSRFLCVDDQSCDGSVEYLAEQDDVDVFVSNVRYLASRRGRIWRETLFEMHGKNRWYLNVDIDEYFVFHDFEHRSLEQFIGRMRELGVTRCPAPMIDCYPEGIISGAHFDGQSDKMPWEVAPLFDGRGYTLGKTRRALSMEGGVRPRTFDAVVELMKYPLMYWRDGDSLGQSIHQPAPYGVNFSPIFGVLLHFKFFSDTESRANAAVEDNQYYDNAREYRKIVTTMAKGGGALDFRGPLSIPFRGSKDLMERGFFQSVWQ